MLAVNILAHIIRKHWSILELLKILEFISAYTSMLSPLRIVKSFTRRGKHGKKWKQNMF